MQEKELDMTKGFDEAVGKPDPKIEAKEKIQKDKAEAVNLVHYITNLFSTGQIEVKVLRPRRKEGFARQGMLIGVRADFHTRTIWCTVAYGAGIDKKVNGKKVFVPYTDSYKINEIEPIKIVNLKEEAEKQTKAKENE